MRTLIRAASMVVTLAVAVAGAWAQQVPIARVQSVSVSVGSDGTAVVEVLFTSRVSAEVVSRSATEVRVRTTPATVSVPLFYPVHRGTVQAVRIERSGPMQVDIRVTVSGEVEVRTPAEPSERLSVELSRRQGAEVAVAPSAARRSVAERLPDSGAPLELREGQARLLLVPGLRRVAVSNPSVADVVTVSDREIILNGLKEGEATLILWTAAGTTSHPVIVASARPSETDLALRALRAALPEGVRLLHVGRAVVLSGAVQDQIVRDRLVASVRAALKDLEVVDQLDVRDPVQVQLEVRIVEVNRSSLRDLGVNWGMTFQPETPGGGVFLTPINTERQFLEQTFLWIVSGGIFPPEGYSLFFRLAALVQQGLARVLAAPNVVTMAGKEARLVVGGQVPLPSQNGGVEYRPFGVVLNSTPEVDPSGRITLKLHASSSDLDFSRVIQVAGGQIPALVDRSVSTQVSMMPGEVLGIGGMIGRTSQEVVSKIPILGDLPIIGELFRSRRFQTGETEVVFLVTPRIVRPAKEERR